MPRRYNANEFMLRHLAKEAQRMGTFQRFQAEFTDVNSPILFKGVGGAFLAGGELAEAMPWDQIQAVFEESQYRMREIFDPKGHWPGSGSYRYPALEQMSKHWAHYVRQRHKIPDHALPQLIREGWGIGNAGAAQMLSDALTAGGMDNFPMSVIDDDSGSVLRAGVRVGDQWKEMNKEFGSFLEEVIGWHMPGGKNPAKRLKALMSLRGFGNMEMGKAFKVGVLGARTREDFVKMGVTDPKELKDLMDAAMDGSSMIRESAVRHQIGLIERDAKELLKTTGTSTEAELARRRGRAMQKQAQNLRQQLKQGRLFGNTRVMGLEVYDINGSQQVQQILEQGQIKGDFRIISDKIADRIAKGMDIFTGVGNVKKELAWGVTDKSKFRVATLLRQRAAGLREKYPDNPQMLAKAEQMDISASRMEDELKALHKQAVKEGRGIARFFSLEGHHPHDVYLDVQSLSSFPEFFDPDILEQTMLGDFQKLTEAGSEGFQARANALIKMADDFDERLAELDEKGVLGDRTAPNPLLPADPSARAQLEESAAFARRWRDLLMPYRDEETGKIVGYHGIDPLERQDLMRQLLDSHKRHLTKTKNDKLIPRFRIPDAQSAGVITTAAADELPMHLRTLSQGAVGYDARTGVWVFNAKTWGELIDTFGGADLDDTLVNMLRYDEESKSLKSLMFRQPNSLTEFAVLDVDIEDAWVSQAMEAKGVKTQVYQEQRKIASAARAQMRQLQADINRLQADIGSKQFDEKALRRRLAQAEANVNSIMAQSDAMLAWEEARGLRDTPQHGKIIRELEKAEAALAKAQSDMGIYAEYALQQKRVADARGAMQSWLQTQGKQHFEGIDFADMRRRRMIEEVTLEGGRKYYKGSDNRLKIMTPEKEPGDKIMRWTPKTQLEKLKTYVNSAGALGRYSNYRMVLDSYLRGMNLSEEQVEFVDQYARNNGLKYHKRMNVLLHERAIDASIQASGIRVAYDPETMGYLLDEAQRAEDAMDFTSMSARDAARKRKIIYDPVTGQPMHLRLSLDEIQRMALRQQMENIVAQRMALGEAGTATLDAFGFASEVPGLDPYMVKNRLFGAGLLEEAESIFGELATQHDLSFGFADILYSPNDPRAQVAIMANRHRQALKKLWGDDVIDEDGNVVATSRIKGIAGEYQRSIGIPEIIEAQQASGMQRTAQDLIEKYNQLVEEHKLIDIEIDPQFEDMRKMLPAVDWGAVEAGMWDELTPFLTDAGVGDEASRYVGEDVYKRMWALMSEVMGTNRSWALLGMTNGTGISIGVLADRAHKFALLQDLNLDPQRRAAIEEELAQRWTLADIQKTQEHLRNMSVAEGLSDITSPAELARMKREIYEASIDNTVNQSDVYSRISKGLLNKANTKSGRGVLAGVAALTAVGLIKLSRDREITPEETTGATPQLPGGAPYLGPTSGGFDFDSGYINPPNRGITYDIYARGADPATMMRDAQWMTGATSTSGSVYESRQYQPQNIYEEMVNMIL